MMGTSLDRFGVMLAFSWDHIMVMLGSFLHHAGTNEIHPKCCGADFGSRIKISGSLLGQNDQNFEIYPFDWSQVASWGLAAEGEALTISYIQFAYEPEDPQGGKLDTPRLDLIDRCRKRELGARFRIETRNKSRLGATSRQLGRNLTPTWPPKPSQVGSPRALNFAFQH